jgi:hypothetical protein
MNGWMDGRPPYAQMACGECYFFFRRHSVTELLRYSKLQICVTVAV